MKKPADVTADDALYGSLRDATRIIEVAIAQRAASALREQARRIEREAGVSGEGEDRPTLPDREGAP